MQFPGECPVCKSIFLALACRRQTLRAGSVDVFYCMECMSFCSPFAPEHLNGPTLNHHLRVFERNLGFTSLWLERLKAHHTPSKILDIGCGIGSLLYAAREKASIDGIGYDLDTEACAHGCNSFRLDLRGRQWTSCEDTPSIDLITCIMDLEHIKWPRPLLLEIVRASKKYQCPAFISVPWFNRDCWSDLHGPYESPNLLESPCVHVTHFSEQGFIKALRGMGGKDFLRISGIPWPGYIFWG